MRFIAFFFIVLTLTAPVLMFYLADGMYSGEYPPKPSDYSAGKNDYLLSVAFPALILVLVNGVLFWRREEYHEIVCWHGLLSLGLIILGSGFLLVALFRLMKWGEFYEPIMHDGKVIEVITTVDKAFQTQVGDLFSTYSWLMLLGLSFGLIPSSPRPKAIQLNESPAHVR